MSRDQNNSGTLGKNERREKETHPTHSGQCTIDGKQYWISAWVKEGRNGRFFSLSFRPKMAREHQGASQNPPPRGSRGGEPEDENIPF
jgi:hypothetical protein